MNLRALKMPRARRHSGHLLLLAPCLSGRLYRARRLRRGGRRPSCPAAGDPRSRDHRNRDFAGDNLPQVSYFERYITFSNMSVLLSDLTTKPLFDSSNDCYRKSNCAEYSKASAPARLKEPFMAIRLGKIFTGQIAAGARSRQRSSVAIGAGQHLGIGRHCRRLLRWAASSALLRFDGELFPQRIAINGSFKRAGAELYLAVHSPRQ